MRRTSNNPADKQPTLRAILNNHDGDLDEYLVDATIAAILVGQRDELLLTRTLLLTTTYAFIFLGDADEAAVAARALARFILNEGRILAKIIERTALPDDERLKNMPMGMVH